MTPKEGSKLARIPLISPEKATGEAKETLAEIEGIAGKVPNAFRALANNGGYAKGMWQIRQALMTDQVLPKRSAEAIALAVSAANACEYCVVNHSASLERLGESPESIEAIRAAQGADEAEEALLSFAVQVSKDPFELRDEDFSRLEQLGYSQEEVFDAAAVAIHYTAMNRFLDTFLVDLE